MQWDHTAYDMEYRFKILYRVGGRSLSTTGAKCEIRIAEGKTDGILHEMKP